MDMRNTDEQFLCSISDMSITNIDFKGYAVSHIREKSYHCYLCEKEIAKYAYLQQHMSIHIREKPYPCCQCDKSFRKKTVI